MNPLVKDALDSAKQAFAESNKVTVPQDAEKEKDDITVKLSEYDARIKEAESKQRQLETENLRLQQDLSENTRFTQSVLDKLENTRASEMKQSYGEELSDEEVAEKLNTKPKDVLLKIIRSEIDKVANNYVEKSRQDTTKLVGDLESTKVALAKMALKEKYDGVDADWDELVKFGDKYKAYTQHVSDPSHLEAFYLMFKGMKGEAPKKKNGKTDLEALLREKLSASIDGSSSMTGKPVVLSAEQKRIAERYGLSDEDYNALNVPEMNVVEYRALRKEKK